MRDRMGMDQIQIGLEKMPSDLVVQRKIADGLDTAEIVIGLEDPPSIQTGLEDLHSMTTPMVSYKL